MIVPHWSNWLVTTSHHPPCQNQQKATHGGKIAQIMGRADKAWAVARADTFYKWPD